MDRPIPAPREGKRPIPTPRRNINNKNNNNNNNKLNNIETELLEEEEIPKASNNNDIIREEICNVEEEKNSEKMNFDNKNSSSSSSDQFNTFSKRVSNASKQIAGDLGQLVQDRKKAVIEGTRQSMRRITRRFSSASQVERNRKCSDNDNDQIDNVIESIDIFKNISFQSPMINRTESIYSNVIESNRRKSSSNESLNLPPPQHPPPPLPGDNLNYYDAPSSCCSLVASSSNSSGGSSSNNNRSKIIEEYERIYPTSSNLHSSNLEISSSANEEIKDLSRSASWTYYDCVEELTDDDVNDERTIEENILVPDKVENNNIRSSSESQQHTNSSSVYENYQLPVLQRSKSQVVLDKIKASKSVLLQFDPLNHEVASSETDFSDMNILDELLQGELYSNISEAFTFDEEGDWSVSNESETEDFLNPPTPPLRVDSLPEDETAIKEQNFVPTEEKSPKICSKGKSRSSWFTDSESSPPSRPLIEPKKNWLMQVKQHVLVKTPEVFKINKTPEILIERPILGGRNSVNKKGMLYKVQGGPVEDLFGEYSGRWCVLENTDLFCYSDNTCNHLKEHFPASSILSIQLLQDAKYKYKYDNDDLHCFELNVTGKSRGGHIYGSKNLSERRFWLQCLAEMLTQRFKSRITTNFIRMGWAYVREGVSGTWNGAWLILSERELTYSIDGRSVKTMDLRKARCILLQAQQGSNDNPRTNDKGPNMLIDCPDLVLYLRMWTSRETKVWCHIVKLEAHNNGANIDQQQLTKNDVPVVVEKCINFIYAHGSMSEGIYRKAGKGSLISELLNSFRKNAFTVQLTMNNYTEYEVGTALKRFFRELPEPLFGCDHRQYLYEVAKHNVKDEKIRMFKAALDQLPLVAHKTARILLGHLHFISNQHNKNKMTVENLAAIWGPTLMYFEDKERPGSANTANHVQDSEVVSQLIKYYRSIFPEDPGELEKEKLMLKVLKKHMQSPQGCVNQKTSGDLRIWIYIFNKEGKSYNIGIGPHRTAYDVCVELSEKIKTPIHEIILEESVLGDKLLRPVHHSEKLLDVVLKWSYWDEPDRKDNYLTCVYLSKYWEYIREKPLPLSGELKFADSKSRVFKPLMFQFTQSTLSAFKDKSSDVSLYSWKVEDITWYLGHETKRNPQSRWTITFLINDFTPNRTRNNPYFGNVLVWNDASVRANWISGMLRAKYHNNLTPPPRLVTI